MSNEPSGPDRSSPDGSGMLGSGEGTDEFCRGGNADTAAATQAAGQGRKIGFQFSISTLLLMMTLAAAVLSVFRVHPGVTILLVLVVTPPLVRTCVATMQRQRRGQLVSPGQKVALFLRFLVRFVALFLSIVVLIVAPFAAIFGIRFAIDAAAALPLEVLVLLIATLCVAAVRGVVKIVKHTWGKPQALEPNSTQESSIAEKSRADQAVGGERR